MAVIMYKYTIFPNIVCLIPFNLKVVYLSRALKYLMLDLFNCNIFPVDGYKYISCT